MYKKKSAKLANGKCYNILKCLCHKLLIKKSNILIRESNPYSVLRVYEINEFIFMCLSLF